MRIAVASLVVVLLGCGARSEGKTIATRTFGAAERCGQHLLETRFVATGGEHGEVVVLRSCGERDLAGVMEIEIETVHGPIDFGGRWGKQGASDRCLAGRPAAGSRGPTKTGEPAADTSRSGEPGMDAPSSLIEVAESASTRERCFAASELQLQTGRLVAGSEIVVRLWSPEPSDLDGALIQLRHLELRSARSHEGWEPVEPSRDKTRRPPAPLAEDRPPRPRPDAEWISGYWSWTAGEWVWNRGTWKDAEAVARRPPPPRTETRPEKPAGAVWVPGAWFWDGARFVWSPGRWVIRPAIR